MTRFRRRLSLLFALGVGLLALTGCDHFAPDPIAFTRVGDVPVMRMCLPMTVSSIVLKTYADEDDYGGTPIWAATGSADTVEGAEFALGTAPVGMSVSSGSTDRAEVVSALGERFAVLVEAVDSYGEHEFFAYLTASDFDESAWLDGFGPVESPCVREPCPPGYACLNEWPQPSGPAIDPEPTWLPTRSN